MKTKLSIIIVHYKVKYLLEKCLVSILSNEFKNYEIIIVDNNSQDDSQNYILKLFPEIIWIQNNENIGFSKANNLASKYAKGEYILFLNPDTILPFNIFQEILDFSDNQLNFGALGVKIVDENNIFRPESKRNIPNPFNTFQKLYSTFLFKSSNHSYYLNDLDNELIHKIPVLTGAFFLTKKTTFNLVGKFDERYFMYAEDIDLSLSILNQNLDNYYYGKQKIIHFKGKSTIKNKKYYFYFFNSIEQFINKYYRTNILLKIILILGLKIRYYITLFIYVFNKS